ncbi:Schizosaccharomyces specific protein [Schizosaccharomyces osmophilus]|uniref:Schizosaccharomyces specific protein n=1 Tax=Schizosaccharomyces osmophilus TaxID=2545709 RepID=A0AAF0AW74_9SCHI|nr:Schizosaccharomyces specific protein [Schizosaccharomyces osmophilus]WBW73218.1 Schizosaccharomyces specific protein [Schizosaccharomyces osmophilus]
MNTRPPGDIKDQNISFEDDNQCDPSVLSSSPTRRWKNCTLQRRGSRASTTSEDCGERYRSRSRGSLATQYNPDANENHWYSKLEQMSSRTQDRNTEEESSADNMTSLHDQTVPNPIAEAWRKYFRKQVH